LSITFNLGPQSLRFRKGILCLRISTVVTILRLRLRFFMDVRNLRIWIEVNLRPQVAVQFLRSWGVVLNLRLR
jgi:hypothetical protein